MTTVRSARAAQADRFVLRRMGLGDLAYVMDLHRRAFPTNVVGRLGSRLLKAYYRTFLDGPEVWAEVATVDGEPVGFLVGVLDVGPYQRHRRTDHGVALAAAGVFAVFQNPLLVTVLVLRRVRRLLGRIRHHTARDAADTRRLAVLSHVAVEGSYRELGVGGALVEAFVAAARGACADAATLATLDDGAGPFYERRGWIQGSRSQTADHRTIRIYELRLRADAVGSLQ